MRGQAALCAADCRWSEAEEAAIQQESTILSLKKKHQDAIGEMSEQMDQLSKLKAK